MITTTITMATMADPARLNQTISPSLRCGSRPRSIPARNLPAGAPRPILGNGVKFPTTAVRTSAVSLLNRSGRLRGPDLLSLGTSIKSRSGFPGGLYSRERSSISGFPPAIDKFSSRVVVAQAKKNNTVGAPERVLAALGYILPLFDGIQYGRYFFLQFPAAEAALRPLYPLLSAYKSFPYSNFIAFFALYLLVVRNDGISRYVRFNAMQAVVLDVLLILPTLVERTFAPRGGVGFELLIIFYNTVFLFLVACFFFGVVSCILGRTPRLPIVADAADAQV